MKVFSIVLSRSGEDLSVLTKDGFIPSGSLINIDKETGVSLKSGDFILNGLYHTKHSIRPINGWEWETLVSLKKLEKNFGELLCEALGKFWNVMPNFQKNIKLPSLFMKKKFSNEAIFFPGSFNPWHAGHMTCLKLCPNKAKIIAIPDNNPWKELGSGSCKWEKYRNLCLILKKTPCSVYPGFLGLKKENPTINWLPKTKVKEKTLLVGDDSFLSLINWRKSKKLISVIQKIYVVPRIGNEKDLKLMKEKLIFINPKLKIKFLPPHKYQNISSTKIRGD